LYENLKDFTFETKIVELTYENAVIIQKWKLYENSLTDEEVESLKLLIQQVDLAVKSFGDGGAFMRLSSLSPKDAIVYKEYIQKLKDQFTEDLKEVISIDHNGIVSPFDKPTAEKIFLQSLKNCLKVHSGVEVFSLLKSSARVSKDFALFFELPKESWCNNIIIRKWMEIDLAMEFRGICSSNKLTAISQYVDTIYFEELDTKDENSGKLPIPILEQILEFWENVKHLIPFDSCCVDFAVFPHKVIIVELNPLDVYTGSALFSWKEDADILVDGLQEEPFVFTRVLKKEEYKGMVYEEWQDVITGSYSKLKQKLEDEFRTNTTTCLLY